jgi:uncharacterized protein YfkK (UPF0435 family)
MNNLEMFKAIKRIVKKEENYKPRKFQTIGGMWTVDTYEYNGVTYQLQDEGYTDLLQNKKVCMTQTYDQPIHFRKGNEQDLLDIYNKINLDFGLI